MSQILVITTIDDPDLLEDVLEAWHALGVSGATVFETSGMGRLMSGGLRDDIPLLPRLSDFLDVRASASRTIFSVAPDQALAEKMAAEVERIVGDLNRPHTGVLYMLPVLKAYGLDRQAQRSQAD